MVGSALVRALQAKGDIPLTVERSGVDLTRQEAVEAWMARERPQWVFLAAARVGGIGANAAEPASFIYENLAIASNVIHAAYKTGVEKLLFLGSSCIYPKNAPQPIPESALLTGLLEPTNQPYAIAKIAGIELCQAYRRQYGCDFISAMPTNLYGPGDSLDLEKSHVVPALMQKIHVAKETGADTVALWGSGRALREFLHVDDLAAACLMLMKCYSAPEPINVGTGKDISILGLAELLGRIIGFEGPGKRFVTQPDRPDGTFRKCLDVSKIQALGWEPKYGLEEGLRHAYAAFLKNDPTKLCPKPTP